MKLTRSFMLIVLALFIVVGCRQLETPAAPTLDPQYGTHRGDRAADVTVDVSGRIYTVGTTEGSLDGSQRGAGDVYLRRYSSSGTLVWGKQFGTRHREEARAVSADSNGNVYVVGATYGSLSGSHQGRADIFVRKYSKGGVLLWGRQFGTPWADGAGGVTVDAHGNVAVVGGTLGSLDRTNPDPVNTPDALIRVYNPEGEVLWTRQFGSAVSDYAESVVSGPDGSFYVTGSTYGALDGSGREPSNLEAFLRKYSASGKVLWTRQFTCDTYNSSGSTLVRDVAVGQDGTIYIAGEGGCGAFLQTYSARGVKGWRAEYGQGANEAASGVALDTEGNIYLSGSSHLSGPNGDGTGDVINAFVLKYTPHGRLVWDRTFGTGEWTAAYGVAARGPNAVYVAGVTMGNLGAGHVGSTDGFLRRLGVDGQVLWTR